MSAAPIPILGVSVGTYVEPDHGVQTDLTYGGKPLQRELSDRDYYDLRVVYSALNQSEHRTLIAFLAEYKSTEMEVTVDGEVYTGVLVGRPRRVFSGGGSYADVTITLRAWRDE